MPGTERCLPGKVKGGEITGFDHGDDARMGDIHGMNMDERMDGIRSGGLGYTVYTWQYPVDRYARLPTVPFT